LVSAIIIFFLPNIFEKYIAKQEQVTISNSSENYSFFVDIDNDGYSECYEFSHDRLGNKEAFNLLNSTGGNIAVLNLSDFLLPRSVIGFSDFNHNKIPELDFLSYQKDSIFINIYEYDISKNKGQAKTTSVFFKRKFITKGNLYNGVLDIISDSIRFADLNHDGYDEAIFNLEAGFTFQPRSIFAYDIKNDSMWSMPKEGTMILNFIPYDINNDKKPELLLTTYSPNNIYPPEQIKQLGESSNPDSIRLYHYFKNFVFDYGDNNPWLMVLNSHLNFLFKPDSFPAGFAYINTLPFKINNKTYILAKYENKDDTTLTTKLLLYNESGKKIKENNLYKSIERMNFNFFRFNNNYSDIRIIDNIKGIIYKISPDLKLVDPIKSFKGYNSNIIKAIDINGDNRKEFLFTSNNSENILITQSDFSFPTTISVPNDRQGLKAITIKKQGHNKPPLLALQFNKVLYLFSYTKNPLYPLKYIIYLGIYFIIFLFIFFVQKINAKKLEKENLRLENEVKKRTHKISEQNNRLNEFIKIVSTKNIEIGTQNQQLIEFRKEITYSIDYAKYIQDAILPKMETLTNEFPESFLIYLPRDIVSGDFYWWKKIENKFYLAISDCTGHGVPGAFMSLLGITYLQQAILLEGVKKPHLILNNIRKKIITALKQTGKPDEQFDGMDMILLQIDRETNTIQFSGAHNPIYIITENNFFAANPELQNHPRIKADKKGNISFIEIKGNRMPVAIYQKMHDFTEYTIKIQKGDEILSFTDGYYDQFGGKNSKKIKLSPIKTILFDSYHDSLDYQKQTLIEYLDYWKTRHLKAEQTSQIDDITVLGIKF